MTAPATDRPARISIVTVSDRAARGEYEDKGGPGAEAWLHDVVTSPMEISRVIIPDGREGVAATLRELVEGGADLILVTGGTGPAPRDQTPEAVMDVAEKELEGFGEEMRRASLREPAAALAISVVMFSVPFFTASTLVAPWPMSTTPRPS